jgi:hypothetical protein
VPLSLEVDLACFHQRTAANPTKNTSAAAGASHMAMLESASAFMGLSLDILD